MNPVQEFNEKYQQALQTTPMPVNVVSVTWFETAKKALELASPISLGITQDQFIILYHKRIAHLTLMDFAVLSNNLESKSARDLDITMEEYLLLLKISASYVAEWNTSTKVLHDDISRQMALDALKRKGASAEEIGQFIAKTAQA